MLIQEYVETSQEWDLQEASSKQLGCSGLLVLLCGVDCVLPEAESQLHL